MTVGERLKEARMEKYLTASALARAIGMGKYPILRMEHNQDKKFGIYCVKKLCVVLGISADWLLGVGEENRPDIHPGVKIREARKKLRYTQEKLAEKVGIDSQTIHNYEAGKFFCINYVGIASMCEELDISADWLFGIDE